MAVNELRALMIMLYEYLVSKGSRLERDYLDLFDSYYKLLLSSRPERRFSSADVLQLIETKSKFDEFCEIQKDIYQILSLYKNAGFGDSAENPPPNSTKY